MKGGALMKFFLASPFLCLLALGTIPPVHAQNVQDLNDKLYRLERDLQILQKQYYRDEEKLHRKRSVVKTNVSNASSAQVEAQILEIDEEMRRIRGDVEEVKYDLERLIQRFESFERDIDLRLMALEQSAKPDAFQKDAEIFVPSSAPLPSSLDAPKALIDTPATMVDTGDTPSALTAPETQNTPETASPPSSTSEEARRDYDAAFKLLNQTNYEDAANAFDRFIQTHPNNKLIGNAYYWLGETHYVRGDYLTAAETFRTGFETMPDGPKAPDNLLKLAMSLHALERKEEACVVLKKLTKDHADSSDVIGRKSKQEYERVGCRE